MKKKSVLKSAFFNFRALLGFALCFAGLAIVAFALIPSTEKPARPSNEAMRDMPTLGEKPGNESRDLGRLEQFWNDRVTYPTGQFNPAWLRQAADQDSRMPTGIPGGRPSKFKGKGLFGPGGPLALSTLSFTALRPMPLTCMTGSLRLL